jgi:hypothetical protein
MALTSAVSSSQSERITLGQGVDLGMCTGIFQINTSPTWTGSLQPVKRLAGAPTFTTCSYTVHLNGTTSNAAITGSGVFSLDVSGCDLAANHSMTASGSATFVFSLNRN